MVKNPWCSIVIIVVDCNERLKTPFLLCSCTVQYRFHNEYWAVNADRSVTVVKTWNAAQAMHQVFLSVSVQASSCQVQIWNLAVRSVLSMKTFFENFLVNTCTLR